MKWQVILTQTVWERATVTVEADNEEEAEKKGYDMAMNGDVDWHFSEAPDAPEVIAVEKLP